MKKQNPLWRKFQEIEYRSCCTEGCIWKILVSLRELDVMLKKLSCRGRKNKRDGG